GVPDGDPGEMFRGRLPEAGTGPEAGGQNPRQGSSALLVPADVVEDAPAEIPGVQTAPPRFPPSRLASGPGPPPPSPPPPPRSRPSSPPRRPRASLLPRAPGTRLRTGGHHRFGSTGRHSRLSFCWPASSRAFGCTARPFLVNDVGQHGPGSKGPARALERDPVAARPMLSGGNPIPNWPSPLADRQGLPVCKRRRPPSPVLLTALVLPVAGPPPGAP